MGVWLLYCNLLWVRKCVCVCERERRNYSIKGENSGRERERKKKRKERKQARKARASPIHTSFIDPKPISSLSQTSHF